jgi:transcriptional regulator with XRE-family HTH domain
MPDRVVPNGVKIRELRHAKALTQMDLKDAAKISERTLRKIETSNAPLARKKLQTIAMRLDVSPEELFLTPTTGTHGSDPARSKSEGTNLFELHNETSGSKLLERFSTAPEDWMEDVLLDYRVREDISKQQAAEIQKVLLIIFTATGREFQNKEHLRLKKLPIDGLADLWARAELHEAINSLRQSKINLFVGSYLFREWLEYEHEEQRRRCRQVKRIVRITFAKVEKASITEEYHPGLPAGPYWQVWDYKKNQYQDEDEEELPF